MVKRSLYVHTLKPFKASNNVEIDLVFGDKKVTAWYTIYYNYDKIKEIDPVFLPDISRIANFAIDNTKRFDMKKLLILLLVFVTLIPGNASGIDIQKEGTAQNKGVRMPSITQVEANYENGLITIEVKGYTDGAQAFVSDSQGNIVSSTMSSITNKRIIIKHK